MVTETGIFRIPPFFVCVTAPKEEEEGIMSEGSKEQGNSLGHWRWDERLKSATDGQTQKTVSVSTFFAAEDSS